MTKYLPSKRGKDEVGFYGLVPGRSEMGLLASNISHSRQIEAGVLHRAVDYFLLMNSPEDA